MASLQSSFFQWWKTWHVKLASAMYKNETKIPHFKKPEVQHILWDKYRNIMFPDYNAFLISKSIVKL